MNYRAFKLIDMTKLLALILTGYQQVSASVMDENTLLIDWLMVC